LIIWQGLGFLAFLVPVLIAILFEGIFDKIYGAGFTNRHTWIWGVSMMVGAALTYVLARYLAAKPARELIDPKTGETIVLRKKHTLFWIPLEYCAVILVVAGVIRCFV
jgi:hypothetical protein